MYNATRHLTSLVQWEDKWIHFGTEGKIKFDLLNELINQHFQETELLLIQGRTNSTLVNSKEIMTIMKPILGIDSFQIWTKSMDKVIKFDRIGVLNIGQYK